METKVDIERLEALGLKAASSALKIKKDRARKMMIAYEFYRFVKDERIQEFNTELYKTSEAGKRGYGQYTQLSLTPLEQYQDVPPGDVLEALEVAQNRKCFDSFEVAHIVTQIKTPDPILFGRIEGCSDHFYVAQWDDDIKIEDLLKENEG